jgi:hypothetical protein
MISLNVMETIEKYLKDMVAGIPVNINIKLIK